MKGIILAGGSGTRLYPSTAVLSKQILPVYDKPLIYYPLSVLIMAGIREILIISTPRDLPAFRQLLGDGSALGLRLEYIEQPRPEGLAQAFILGEEFIADEPVCLILGDNIFYGQGLREKVREASRLSEGGVIFGYRVSDPERYGVVTFDSEWQVTGLVEKPSNPPTNWAVTGLYFYDSSVVEHAKQIKPSARGELEITDLNLRYAALGRLRLQPLGRGIAWLDTGTHEAMLKAANFIETIETRQGLRIACLEEIAYREGLITLEALEERGKGMGSSGYGRYLVEFAAAQRSSP